MSYGPVRNTENGEMEKIVQKTPNWAHVFMTAYALWVTGATTQKVSDGELIYIFLHLISFNFHEKAK